MNLLEILKNVPKGTRLYSPAFGEVEFICLYNDKIMTEDITNIQRLFYKNGNFYIDGECMLFPSRENRDWNNVCLFKDGDILISSSGNPFILKEVKNKYCTVYCGIDVIDRFWEYSNNWTLIKGVRKATEKEIDLFFERLKKEGFKWNSNTLTLEKLLNKFDVTTLKPFDRVLVRDSKYYTWTCDVFSYTFADNGRISVDNNHIQFKCIGSCWKQCIPYNDKTKHLVGTDKDCPDYYKTW